MTLENCAFHSILLQDKLAPKKRRPKKYTHPNVKMDHKNTERA